MQSQSRLLRVCYFGTYRAEYSRNQVMIAGLRRAGVEVVECQAQLWRDIEDRVQVTRGGWRSARFLFRALRAYAALLRKYRAVGDYDVLMLGYPGQFDVCLARLLSWLRRRPLVWDVFMSIYLIARERGLHRASSLTVAGLRRVEALACRLPDRLISDTAEYVQWYCRTHSLRPERFRLVPTGADDRVFQPLPPPPAGPFRAIYYGTFIPNHGVGYIVEAARLLAAEPGLIIELVGDGPDRAAAEAQVRAYGLANVSFRPWLSQTELVALVREAAVCLGAFGQTPQSLMTVQNKIYEGLAMARPVISGDSPAARAALEHGRDAWLVDRADPASLAAGLLALRDDPVLRQRLAAAGHQLFCERYNLEAVGRQAAAHLHELAG